jgi:long-chain acyl-CoA synthetase
VAGLASDLGIPGVICMGQDVTVPELAAETAPAPPAGLRTATPTDPGVLLFSGGTTGLPKAIEHTHGRLLAAMRSMKYIWPVRTDGEVFLPIAPFTHIYGFLTGVLIPLSVCGETVIPERFQPEHIVELLASYRVTYFGGGPPAIYAGVLAAPNLGSADLSALRVCPAGGAPFPVELMKRWRRVTGVEIREGYGMTEIAPISGAPQLLEVRPGSAGKPVPGTEVQIVDLDNGLRLLPSGERGELRVRGPHMMMGYRNRPEETAQTIRDGFIYTGDIGYLDQEGFLFITDRKKDVVFVKGFNVFPREVEEVIHTHPKVGVAGVAGVPDARSGGERLIAFVVPRTGEAADAAEISAYCISRLAPYKCPAEVRVVEQLPLTGAQKLDRIALRRAACGVQETPAGRVLRGPGKKDESSEMIQKCLKEQLVGAWTLISYVLRDIETGAESHPFGERPLGLILYTPDGYMSAQLQRPDRVRFADEDLLRTTQGEYAAAGSSYIAYSGRFFVDEGKRSLSHEMAVSFFPNWFGQRQVRLVELNGEYLQLSTDAPVRSNGTLKTATLTWRRAPFN